MHTQPLQLESAHAHIVRLGQQVSQLSTSRDDLQQRCAAGEAQLAETDALVAQALGEAQTRNSELQQEVPLPQL